MAWSSAVLSADEISLASDDKPIIAAHAHSDGLNDSQWSATATATFASADVTESGYSARAAVDGLPGLLTKPDAANTAFSLMFDFGTAGIEFDGIGILNHNLNSISQNTVTFLIADNSSFSTNAQTVASFTISSDNRTSELECYHTGSTARRYSGVRYIRMAMSGSSGVPHIGQIVFLRRYQLRYNPNRPWDPTAMISKAESFESQGGALTRYVRYKGRRVLDANWSFDNSDDHDTVKDWYTATKQGTESFVWINDPDASPDEFLLMTSESGLSLELPYVGPTERTFGIEALEQGPSFLELE